MSALTNQYDALNIEENNNKQNDNQIDDVSSLKYNSDLMVDPNKYIDELEQFINLELQKLKAMYNQ